MLRETRRHVIRALSDISGGVSDIFRICPISRNSVRTRPHLSDIRKFCPNANTICPKGSKLRPRMKYDKLETEFSIFRRRMMKPYLTYFFIFLSIIAIIVSYQFDVRWNGIVGWGLAFILLSFATYFTKFIRDK